MRRKRKAVRSVACGLTGGICRMSARSVWVAARYEDNVGKFDDGCALKINGRTIIETGSAGPGNALTVS